MSGSHQSPRCFQHRSCLSQSPADPASLVEKPEETARARLNYGKTSETEPVEEAFEETDLPEDADEAENVSCPIEQGYARGEFHEEIRCFRFPRHIVQREYALLREHKLKQFSQLAQRVYEELSATILLMRHLSADAQLSGYEIYLISRNLSRPLALLDAIGSHLDDCELVQKSTVPA